MKWYKNMVMSAKMILSFATVAILCLVVGIIGIVASNNLNTSLNKVSNDVAAPLGDMVKYVSSLSDARNAFTTVLLLPANADAQIPIIKESLTLANEALDRYTEKILDDASRTTMNELRALMTKWENDVNTGIELARAGGELRPGTPYYETIAAIKTTTSDMIDHYTKIYNHKIDTGAALAETTDVDALNMLIITIVVMALATLIAVGLGLMNAQLIGKPLRRMAVISDRLGSTGDLEMQQEEMNYLSALAAGKDEVAGITRSLMGVVQMISENAAVLETMSHGDLTAVVKPRSDKDSSTIAVQELLANLNDMFSGISTASSQVNQGARQISDGSQALAQGTTEQASAVEELSASITHIAEQTRKNAKDSDGANHQAMAIRGTAEQGSEKMQRMVKAVQDINEASQSISKIIRTIDDIAFQTNILALNASVEAARAGQQGRGFSVVADEVKSLANRSQIAAQETNELIANSLRLTEDGVEMARDTESALQAIVAGIESVADVIGGIATASNEQATAIDQINRGIDQVSQVVQLNSATSEESAAASQEMAEQATTLNALVARVNLRGQGPTLGAGTRSKPHALPKVPKQDEGYGKY